MSITTKPTRWLLLTTHLGIIVFMISCTVFGTAQQSGDNEVQVENADWEPINNTSFELVGELENTDPWTVAGQELETSDSTLIEDGLQVGDIVRVRGIITEGETWLAYSIEGADEQTASIFVIIGVVDSVDPWSVNGISLNVTDETDVQGDVTVGTIVRVEILLLEDGSWEILSIAPLGESTDMAGCVTVVATVVNVSGNDILFLGWPDTVTLSIDNQTDNTDQNINGDEENGDEANDAMTIGSGDVVQAVVCVSEDGPLVIVQITILHTEDEDTNGGTETTGGEKVLICHKPDQKGGHTLSVAAPAVPAHLGHGDTLGSCP